MEIFSQQLCVNNNQPVVQNRRCNLYTGYNRLVCDTFSPSFCGMKKSQFNNVDFSIIEKFKAPIEKFYSMEDFEEWTDKEYFARCTADFKGRSGDVRYKRESMVCDWDQALSYSNYTNAEKLLIIDGITKDLKPNNDNICPVYNKEILAKTFDEYRTALENNRKLQLDFGKMYRKNLVDMYTECSNVNKNEPQWIIIPSKDNDPEHFKENVEKLQSLSPEEWCTKYTGADFHLRNGDMHIYLENGTPKVALRFNDGLIQEINGEHNDYIIESKYVPMTEKYIHDNNFVTTEKADEMLKKSKNAAPQENQPPKKESRSILSIIKNIFNSKKEAE